MEQITQEDKEVLIKEIMECYPEYSAGSTLQCTKYDYENCRYSFYDIGEDKEMNVCLETLKAGFEKLFADVIAGKIHIFESAAIMDGGNWDATAVDALVQYTLFGELRYG